MVVVLKSKMLATHIAVEVKLFQLHFEIYPALPLDTLVGTQLEAIFSDGSPSFHLGLPLLFPGCWPEPEVFTVVRL